MGGRGERPRTVLLGDHGGDVDFGWCVEANVSCVWEASRPDMLGLGLDLGRGLGLGSREVGSRFALHLDALGGRVRDKRSACVGCTLCRAGGCCSR